MVKVKEMHYEEKYKYAIAYAKREALGPAFIKEKLGEQAFTEFQKEYQKTSNLFGRMQR